MTDAFRPLAAAQARSRGHAGLALLVVSHPVGGLRPSELVGRTAEVVSQLALTPGPGE